MIKTGIIGACGRMGQKNALAVHSNQDLKLVEVIEKIKHPNIDKHYGELIGESQINLHLSSSLKNLCANTEVIIDFTHPLATLPLIKEARKTRTSLVIGTTGFSSEELKEIEMAARDISIVLSGNFSTGINLLLGLVKQSAKVLGSEYNIEIMEQHHNQKVDAPSGTAIMLGKAAATGRGLNYEKALKTGRQGQIGKRNEEEIGMFALRGGGVVGHHSVYFLGPNDKIELTHTAQNRDAFSSGVVMACKWVVRQQPGLYDMLDVLGLQS